MRVVPDTPRCPLPSHSHAQARVFLDVDSKRGVQSSWGVSTSQARLFECPESGLRFRVPAPAEQVAAFYASGYHDRMVGEGADARTRAYEKENRRRVAYLRRFAPGGRVLDVGCSTGLFARQLKAAGFEVFGSDISEYACTRAAALLGDDHVFQGSVEDVQGRLAGSLDAITLMDVIEHFEDVVSPLVAMRELLKPGGVLFLRTPTLSSPFYLVADLSYRLTGGRYTDAALKIYHAEHFYFFTEDSIRTLLADTGYEVLDLQPDPLIWENFRSAEMRHGPVVNLALGAVYFIGRALGRGHGMRVVARRPP